MTNDNGSAPGALGSRAVRSSSTPASPRLLSAEPRSSTPAAPTRAAEVAAAPAASSSTAPPAAAPRTPSTPTARCRTPTSRAASSSTSRCSTGTTTTRSSSAVAESVTPSADAKTWTIKLRQGVTFHNGKDVTPEDVLFTLQRVAGKEPTSAGVALAPIIDFNATKKVDATTVVIQLKTPYAVLQYLLAEYTLGVVPTDYDPAKPGRHRPVQVQVVQRPARTASSSSTTTTGATRPRSTRSTSRTSPTPAPRSTRCRPARCRRSTTCPTT